jgi:hypothetical protein
MLLYRSRSSPYLGCILRTVISIPKFTVAFKILVPKMWVVDQIWLGQGLFVNALAVLVQITSDFASLPWRGIADNGLVRVEFMRHRLNGVFRYVQWNMGGNWASLTEPSKSKIFLTWRYLITKLREYFQDVTAIPNGLGIPMCETWSDGRVALPHCAYASKIILCRFMSKQWKICRMRPWFIESRARRSLVLF